MNVNSRLLFAMMLFDTERRKADGTAIKRYPSTKPFPLLSSSAFHITVMLTEDDTTFVMTGESDGTVDI